MPYKNLNDLPSVVKDKLPKHAQEIYLKAFNHAWDEYKDPSKRRKGKEESQEQVCHKVAWAAVKSNYTKEDDDKWHPKNKD